MMEALRVGELRALLADQPANDIVFIPATTDGVAEIQFIISVGAASESGEDGVGRVSLDTVSGSTL